MDMPLVGVHPLSNFCFVSAFTAYRSPNYCPPFPRLAVTGPDEHRSDNAQLETADSAQGSLCLSGCGGCPPSEGVGQPGGHPADQETGRGLDRLVP